MRLVSGDGEGGREGRELTSCCDEEDEGDAVKEVAHCECVVDASAAGIGKPRRGVRTGDVDGGGVSA